jgi:Holliday junction resolvase RusA-like endonuclease
MIRFTIPLTPITKKNSQRILQNRRTGARFIAPSEQYAQYQQSAMWFVPKRKEPLKGPLTVQCIFYMPTKRRCDLTNHLEAVDDILVAAGMVEDDNYTVIASHDGSRVYVDKDRPRTEVIITEYQEEKK